MRTVLPPLSVPLFKAAAGTFRGWPRAWCCGRQLRPGGQWEGEDLFSPQATANGCQLQAAKGLHPSGNSEVLEGASSSDPVPRADRRQQLASC